MLYGLETSILQEKRRLPENGLHFNPIFQHLKWRWIMDLTELKKTLKGVCVATLLSGAGISMAASSG
jgi:hypothetical protein